MAQATTKDLTTLPVGRLGLIPLIRPSLLLWERSMSEDMIKIMI